MTLRRGLAVGMFGLAAWFLVSWPVGLLLAPDRLQRPAGDVVVLLPLAVASGIGLLRGRRWASGLSLVVLGGLAYDVVHFGVRSAQEQETVLVRLAIAAGIALFLAVLAWIVRRLLVEITAR
jgi:hypothetical protein